VTDESLQASRIGRDNGFAGAEGQPAEAAFPKGFIKGFIKRFIKRFIEVLRGFDAACARE
jgi:hypothetical protein